MLLTLVVVSPASGKVDDLSASLRGQDERARAVRPCPACSVRPGDSQGPFAHAWSISPDRSRLVAAAGGVPPRESLQYFALSISRPPDPAIWHKFGSVRLGKHRGRQLKRSSGEADRSGNLPRPGRSELKHVHAFDGMCRLRGAQIVRTLRARSLILFLQCAMTGVIMVMTEVMLADERRCSETDKDTSAISYQ